MFFELASIDNFFWISAQQPKRSGLPPLLLTYFNFQFEVVRLLSECFSRSVQPHRSGCANLNKFLSGNSGHKARPESVGHEGVFDGQEISTSYAAHAYVSI